MKLTCDYCGTIIDTATQKCCPNCGASYGNDNEIQAENERQKQLADLEYREKQLKLEEMQLRNRQSQQQLKNGNAQGKAAATAVKVGCLIPIAVVGIIFFIIFISALITVIADEASPKDTYETTEKKDKITYSLSAISMPDIPDVPDITGIGTEDTTVPAGPVQDGETLICDGFTLTCAGQSVIYPDGYKAGEGKMCVLFRLVLENTGEKKLYPMNSVSCLCDGFVCGRVYSIEQKGFAYDAVPPGAKAEGYFCFEVPVDGETLTLVYDNDKNLDIANKAVHTVPSD